MNIKTSFLTLALLTGISGGAMAQTYNSDEISHLTKIVSSNETERTTLEDYCEQLQTENIIDKNVKCSEMGRIKLRELLLPAVDKLKKELKEHQDEQKRQRTMDNYIGLVSALNNSTIRYDLEMLCHTIQADEKFTSIKDCQMPSNCEDAEPNEFLKIFKKCASAVSVDAPKTCSYWLEVMGNKHSEGYALDVYIPQSLSNDTYSEENKLCEFKSSISKDDITTQIKNNNGCYDTFKKFVGTVITDTNKTNTLTRDWFNNCLIELSNESGYY